MCQMHISACLVLVFVFPGAIPAAFSDPGLAGELVFPDTGLNCDGVEIILEQSFGLQLKRTYTDLTCNFHFTDIGIGDYFLRVALPGYDEVHLPVRVVGGRVVRPIAVHMKRVADYDRPYGDFTVDASEILDQYPEEAVDLYEKAIKNRNRGDNEEAARQLAEAVKLAPNFYDAQNDLGIVYKSIGRFDDAIVHLWRARDLNPNNADPLVALSAIYLERNELEEAERVSALAVETDSRSASAFFNLGVALYRRSQFERAENALLKALARAREALEIRLALVNVYGKLGRFDTLLHHLDAYLDMASETDDRRSKAERLREQVLKIWEPLK